MQEARCAPDAAQDAAPEPKRRGRPAGSKNKPKQDVPTEPAAPKPKPPPVKTAVAEAPPAEAPAEAPVLAPQLTRGVPQNEPQLQLAATELEEARAVVRKEGL